MIQSDSSASDGFRLCRIDRTDIQVSASVSLGLCDLLRIVRGTSDQQVRSEPDSICNGQIILSQMDAVRSSRQCHIQPVIHDQQYFVLVPSKIARYSSSSSSLFAFAFSSRKGFLR